jgi:hypothetical protein
MRAPSHLDEAALQAQLATGSEKNRNRNFLS